MKKNVWVVVIIMFAFINAVYSQKPEFQGDLKELFKGPVTDSDYDHWIASMENWRIQEKRSLNYHDSLYRKKELAWAKGIFVFAQMMAEDRYFYDPTQRKYTVDRYLEDLKKRYGGLDGVLIWPTYPNLGVDNRNQFDMLRDMPGGLKGVKQMVHDFQKRGVRVFFPIMFWDRGTRRFRTSMPKALLMEMKNVDADGLNGDTMYGITFDFFKASEDVQYPVALQPEVAINDLKMVEWNQLSWGYFWNYEYRPGVSVYKWLESRHQVQITNRWNIDKTNDLQYAFFNGIGFNAWENIWGIWNQIPNRYAEAIRRISSIYHQFPTVWSSAAWKPYFPTIQRGVFASNFPEDDKQVYTFINRDSDDKEGSQIILPYEKGTIYYDLWNGKILTPKKEKKQVYLQFPIEGFGYGAVLAIKSRSINDRLKDFIHQMNVIAKKPLYSYSASWEPLQQRMVTIPQSVKYTSTPNGMVLISGSTSFEFESNGVMIEGDDLPTAIGVQHPWETHPSRSQIHSMSIHSFYMDQYPVTNEQFKQFIVKSNYHPSDDHNFLKDWQNGTYLSGWGEKPVTWVSLQDARAYAQWAGKRLPHEWEWQYAAQGLNGWLYPWGNEMEHFKVPQVDTGRTMRGPSRVDAFRSSESPFRVMDMVGNVWQWTDEYLDDHTRFSVLKGGSYYRPKTSDWYFPGVTKVNEYGKYLLMAPGKDRSGSIGFRCVADLPLKGE